MTTATAITSLDIPGLKRIGSGKVREIFDLGDRLLMVSTDRISAFDYVLPNGIPGKGKVLTQLSRHWFSLTSGIAPNHLIESEVAKFPVELRPHAAALRGRSMIVRKARMFPVECVVRGYLAGSGYKEYVAGGSTSGVKLPAGLQLASRLPEPIFTPATKSTTGHDENISFEKMVSIVGKEDAEKLRDLSIALFKTAGEHAEAKGIIIADTKFEFGRLEEGRGDIILCDEVLTPDSSRFWDRETYRPGISPPSFDKQFVRDHLERTGWDKKPPVPELPAEIIEGTTGRYLEIFRRLTGRPLEA
ncbi:MAG TPA: phosphoribosylaminoimidazolesuccinocarboxamide synthase [Candidatus Saccharimonadales bacterium]|nr:phosphoribosylaminoimidazolesuccinocarboxamide synthase [Candidatus Saccharimonadales bacterium]